MAMRAPLTTIVLAGTLLAGGVVASLAVQTTQAQHERTARQAVLRAGLAVRSRGWARAPGRPAGDITLHHAWAACTDEALARPHLPDLAAVALFLAPLGVVVDLQADANRPGSLVVWSHFVARHWAPDRLQSLSPRAAALLAAGLEQIDRAFTPACDATVIEFELTAELDGPLRRRGLVSSPPLQYCLPLVGDWYAQDAWRRLQPWLHDTLQGAPDAWPARRQWFEQRELLLQSATNGRVLTNMPRLDAIELPRRQFAAQLRLLRLAVARRLGQQLTLDDPFGDGALPVEADGHRMRAHSVGWRYNGTLCRTF